MALKNITLSIVVFLICNAIQLQGVAQNQEKVWSDSTYSFLGLWMDENAYTEAELIPLLAHKDALVRQFAVHRLSEQDSLSTTALEGLAQALQDKSPDVRDQAMAGFWYIGRPATGVLLEALWDFSSIGGDTYPGSLSIVSDIAFATLIKVENLDLNRLIQTYDQKPLDVSASRVDSVQARLRMALYRGSLRAGPELYALLEHEDERIRAASAIEIAYRGSFATDAMPFLTKAFERERNSAVRAAIIYAFSKIPGEGYELFQQLLNHPDAEVRYLPQKVLPVDQLNKSIPQLLRADDSESISVALSRIIYPENTLNPSRLGWLLSLPTKIDSTQFEISDMVRLGDSGVNTVYCTQMVEDDESTALLRSLADSIEERLFDLLGHEDSQIRGNALRILRTIACIKPDLMKELAAALSDDPEAWVNFVIGEFDFHEPGAGVGFIPKNSEAVKNILIALKGNTKELGSSQIYSSADLQRDRMALLGWLGFSHLPRKEVVDALSAVCLESTVLCSEVYEFIESRIGWGKKEIKAHTKLFKDSGEINDYWRKVFTLLSYHIKGDNPPEIVQELLNHPSKELQLTAATYQLGFGEVDDKVLYVLREAIRSNVGKHQYRAFMTFLRSRKGQWIEETLPLFTDSTSGFEMRIDAVNYLLPYAESNERVREVLLLAAAGKYDIDPEEYELQKTTLWALDFSSIPSTPRDFEILESALSAGSFDLYTLSLLLELIPKKRIAADLPLAPFIYEALANEDERIRSGAVRILLPYLEDDDPNKMVSMKAALKDSSEWVVRSALDHCGLFGERCPSLLGEYISQGGPIDYDFFQKANHLLAADSNLIEVFRDRINHMSAYDLRNVERYYLQDSLNAWFTPEFYQTKLDDADFYVREWAADHVLPLHGDIWGESGRLAMILMDAQVRHRIRRHSAEVYRSFNPELEGSGGSSRGRYDLRDFPWPPPGGYKIVQVPKDLLAVNDETTFGEVYDQLTQALIDESDGFEHGLFAVKGVSDAFALVARMERIREDGSPYAEPARWIHEGSPKLSLREFLGDLFFEKPGFFRVIAFVITDDISPGEDIDEMLPDIDLGATEMPDELAQIPLEGKNVLALIYTFERERNAQITPWEDGAPSAREHLMRSGIWNHLGSIEE